MGAIIHVPGIGKLGNGGKEKLPLSLCKEMMILFYAAGAVIFKVIFWKPYCARAGHFNILALFKAAPL